MTLERHARQALLTTELDETNYPEFRDRIRSMELSPIEHAPRDHFGYPRVNLPRPRARPWVLLESTLLHRRSLRCLGTRAPSSRELARMLWFSHSVHETDGRGPTPSSGKLCALELYFACFEASWLPFGIHHYDRAEHCLWQVAPSAPRAAWLSDVPSMQQAEGGALLWIVVCDLARMEAKYGARSARLILLEAGHLMQNLCLLSESLGRCTLPLGGFFEGSLARRQRLHAGDAVLYFGLWG
jgi:SagB-type dehydrogenase family enzyme